MLDALTGSLWFAPLVACVVIVPPDVCKPDAGYFICRSDFFS